MIWNVISIRYQRSLFLWSEMFAALRTFPRSVWILFIGTFLNKFGSFVMPFLTLYLKRRGFTMADAGLALSVYGVGHFAACALGGHLADTIGRRKTIVLSMTSAAVTMAMLSQAQSFTAILILTGLAGLTAELYRPASHALLADLVPQERRITAYSAYRLAFNAGFAFGPATAGFLAEHSLFYLFMGDAFTSLLFGIVAWRALPEIVHTEKPVPWIEASKELALDRRLLQALVSVLLIALVFYQLSSTYSLFVTGLGFAASTYGMLLSLNGAIVALCELPLSALSQRFPSRQVMAAGYGFVGLGFALNAVLHSLPGLFIGSVIFTVGEMLSMPVTSAYISSLAPKRLRGRYMGAYGFTWAIGLICGPNLGMMLLRSSSTLLWLTCGALCALAAFAILPSVKQRESDWS